MPANIGKSTLRKQADKDGHRYNIHNFLQHKFGLIHIWLLNPLASQFCTDVH
jgi:hypothetical protein